MNPHPLKSPSLKAQTYHFISKLYPKYLCLWIVMAPDNHSHTKYRALSIIYTRKRDLCIVNSKSESYYHRRVSPKDGILVSIKGLWGLGHADTIVQLHLGPVTLRWRWRWPPACSTPIRKEGVFFREEGFAIILLWFSVLCGCFFVFFLHHTP